MASVAPFKEADLETLLRYLRREISRFVVRAVDAVEDAGGKRPQFSMWLIDQLIADIRMKAYYPQTTNGRAYQFDALVDDLVGEAAKIANGSRDYRFADLVNAALRCRTDQLNRGYRPQRSLTEN